MGSFEDSQASARRFSHDHYPSDQLIEARAKVDRADEDENLRVYNEERHRLVKAERSNRFDDTKRKQRTPDECKADEKIRHLKSLERKDIYGKEDDDGIFKGASWATVKSRGAHKGKLYDIVKKMPKGAVLHCHLDGTVDANWLIAQANQEPHLYMRASRPLTTHASMYSEHITFRHLPVQENLAADDGFKRANKEHRDIFRPSYLPDTWVPLSLARETFPYRNIYATAPEGFQDDVAEYKTQGDDSKKAFDAFLYSIMTLAPIPADLHAPVTNSRRAWKRFEQTFLVIEGLQTHEIRYKYYLESLRTAIADNISYVEARIIFLGEPLIGPGAEKNMMHSDLIVLFEKALKQVQSELRSDQTFDARIIYSALRFFSPEELRWFVDDALRLKKQFPETIVGFDLVGHEDHGITLREYVPELLRLQQEAKRQGIELPLALHAGETLGDGDPIDENLFDAILLGSKRLGHAFSLARHPLLMDLVREHRICVESCPISNQVLGYVDSTSAHPVLTLLAYGLPVVLSHDDPCQFVNAGLSPDFYQILSASDHVELTSLAVLARNSLEYSLIPDENVKKNTIASWEKQWDAFVRETANMTL